MAPWTAVRYRTCDYHSTVSYPDVIPAFRNLRARCPDTRPVASTKLQPKTLHQVDLDSPCVIKDWNKRCLMTKTV